MNPSQTQNIPDCDQEPQFYESHLCDLARDGLFAIRECRDNSTEKRVGFRIYRESDLDPASVNEPSLVFSSWSELALFAGDLSRQVLEREFASSAKEELLPGELVNRWSWLSNRSQASSVIAVDVDSNNRLNELTQQLLSNEDVAFNIEHSDLALSRGKIISGSNGLVILTFPLNEWINPVLSTRELVGLAIQVLSDRRTKECCPENFSPVLYCQTTREKFNTAILDLMQSNRDPSTQEDNRELDEQPNVALQAQLTIGQYAVSSNQATSDPLPSHEDWLTEISDFIQSSAHQI